MTKARGPVPLSRPPERRRPPQPLSPAGSRSPMLPASLRRSAPSSAAPSVMTPAAPGLPRNFRLLEKPLRKLTLGTSLAIAERTVAVLASQLEEAIDQCLAEAAVRS